MTKQQQQQQRNPKYDAELADKLMDQVGHKFYDQYHHLLEEHPENALELSVALCNLEGRGKPLTEHVEDILGNVKYAYQISLALYHLYYDNSRLDVSVVPKKLFDRYKDIILQHPEYAVELARGITGYHAWEKQEPLPESFLNIMQENPKYADQIGSAVGKLYYIHRERLAAADKNEDINIVKRRERELISQRFAMVIAQPESAKVFVESLYYLEHWQYPLSLQNAFFRAGKHALELLEGIQTVSKNNLSQYGKYLYKFPKHAVKLAYAMIELMNHKLQHCMIYVTAYPEYATEIARGLVKLKEHDLSRYNDFILQHKQFADVLARALVMMEGDPFLLQYKSEILQSPEHAMGIVIALQTMHKLGTERFIPTLLANPESAYSISSGVKVLHKANLLQDYEHHLLVLGGTLAETIVFLRQNHLKSFIQPLLKHPECAYAVKEVLEEYIHASYLSMIQQIDNKEEAIQFFYYAFCRMHDVSLLLMSLRNRREECWIIISSYMDLWEKKAGPSFHTFFRSDYKEPDDERNNENEKTTTVYDLIAGKQRILCA